jgi:NMD protein affecting ribosome stability and mRNA decay
MSAGNQVSWSTRRRKKLLAQGLCSRCGKVAPETGKTLCQSCKEKEYKYKKPYDERKTLLRKQAGLCLHCGEPAKEGKASCAACLDKQKEKQKRIVADRKKNRLCVGCGKTKPKQGNTSCADCLVRMLQVNTAMRARRVEAGICIDCGKNPARPNNQRCRDCSPHTREFTEDRRARLDKAKQEREAKHLAYANELKAKIHILPERLQRILSLRFGIDGKRHTLDQVGKKFNLTRERIRQLQDDALEILNGTAKTKSKPGRKLKITTISGADALASTLRIISEGFNEAWNRYK